MKLNRRQLFVLGLFLAWSTFFPGEGRAQKAPPDPAFSMSSLDMGLLNDDEAVVRWETRRFIVKGPGRATERVRRAVTILKPEGRSWARLAVPYDKFRRIRKLRGRIRQADGAVVRSLKKSDARDLSAISAYSLYEENRTRVAELYHDEYPYTVEFEYEIRHHGLINWPTWYPQRHGAPVEYSRFEIEAPAHLAVRYTTRGAELEPAVQEEGKRKVFRWEVTARPGRTAEPHGPSWREQTPSVHTAPAEFEIEGTRGDMRSWSAFGQWYYQLSKGRTTLPPAAEAEVQARLSEEMEPREKVRTLYRYLQENTRYVSIQLGLGGWQPFGAAYVHERKYGDCKALVNYLQALLRSVGIASYPALIRSGVNEPDILADFPSNQFNHAVLAVPVEQDTLWLEATSQTLPFGHLGAGNEGRRALLITPEGGDLVRTPQSTAATNQQVRRARVSLEATGDATAGVTTQYTGNQQDRVRRALVQRSPRDRRKWLRNSIDIPSFEITDAGFASVVEQAPAAVLPIHLKLPHYASPTGSRLFVRANFMERWTHIPPEMKKEREQPVEFAPYAFVDVDTVMYEVPKEFALEAAPEPLVVERPFARYEARVEQAGEHTIRCTRRLQVTQPSMPSEQYDSFRDFMRRVVQADRAQFVLVRQD